MEAIVAVDKNWAIGKAGQLLQPISEDLKHFRQLTEGKILIYGRKTLATFPAQKPLPNRRNIILSKNAKQLCADGFESYANIPDMLHHLNRETFGKAIVIGGASVYEQLLPYCKKIFVTEIDHAFAEADTYFPNLNKNKDWQISETGEWLSDEKSKLRFRYLTYDRVD